MAKHSRVSGLAAKVGKSVLSQAVKEHRNNEPVFDTGGSLPAGIEGGVALLTDCRFGIHKENTRRPGEYFFIARGTIVSPKVHDGIKVEGLATQIMESVYDTPEKSRKTVSDHIEWVINQMQLLGADTSDASGDNLEEIAASIKEAQPHFRFRTWKGKKQTTGPYAGQEPQTQEVWNGECDHEEDETEDDVVDETDDDDDDDDDEKEEDNTEDESDDDADDDEETEGKEDDLDALAESADDGDDEAAQERLTELAEEAGIDPNEYASWADLVDALDITKDTKEDEDEDKEEEKEDDDDPPEKEDVFSYKPPKARKSVECVVTLVSASKQTCSLKNLDDGKTIYKQVPWSKLLSD